MRKRLVGLVAALITTIAGGAMLQADVRPARSAQRSAALGNFGVGSALVIEPPAARFARELDARERREQIRDWAVLGTVARLGATLEQAAAATYELPPARLPYLDELYSFEYGRGRRVYLGVRVLLFHDANDPDPIATIARLADRVRMENGDLPATLEVYLVRDQPDDGVINVEREPDLTREAVLSPAYGYVEGDGSTPARLADWLSRADDLTFAQLGKDGRLLLGGRRFPATRTAGLTVEDIAVLYQAHEQLDAPHAEQRALLRDLPFEARAAIARIEELAAAGHLTPEILHRQLEALADKLSPDQIEPVFDALRATAGSARAPGFSLDPQWIPSTADPQHPQFLVALRRFATDPCKDLAAIAQEARAILKNEPDETRRTWRASRAAGLEHADHAPAKLCAEIKTLIAPKLLEVAEALERARPADWDAALAGYYNLQSHWTNLTKADAEWAAARVSEAALTFHEANSKIQCARYEGVAGTQVGMTLFYTDLLAKLWESTDYGLSAPVFDVPGFQSAPRVHLPESFQQTIDANPDTRIWFGPRANRVSRLATASGVRFTFEHRYSRIYAAGNNPARPGVEGEPGEDSRRTLGWWDRHFEDVADYEPQYHRQNQIMKWSLITAALVDSPIARYLYATSVDTHLTFASWQRANHGELRFAEVLPAVHTAMPGRECLPIIESYPFETLGTRHSVSGGVSTAGRATPRVTPKIDPSRALGARKPYVSESGGASTATVTRAHPVVARTKVTFENAGRARTNTPDGPIKLATQEVSYARGRTPHDLVIRSGRGNGALGELAITAERGRVRQTWRSGAVESARTGEPTAVNTIEAADAEAQRGHVDVAAEAYQKLIAKPATANDVARLTVVDAAHGRAAQTVDRLGQLESQLADVLPEARAALLKALEDTASAAVARRAHAMFEHGAPLNGDGEVVTSVAGRAVVTRDVAAKVASKARPAATTDLSDGKIYFDGRVLSAHDGLIPDTGGLAARVRRVRGVQIDELDASAFGALPDQMRVPPDRLRMPDGAIFTAPPEPATVRPVAPRRIYLVHSCDADHSTTTTDDDCRP
jgi:hypothetical protein